MIQRYFLLVPLVIFTVCVASDRISPDQIQKNINIQLDSLINETKQKISNLGPNYQRALTNTQFGATLEYNPHLRGTIIKYEQYLAFKDQLDLLEAVKEQFSEDFIDYFNNKQIYNSFAEILNHYLTLDYYGILETNETRIPSTLIQKIRNIFRTYKNVFLSSN